jgi:ABC-type molybdate transport system substrate-binding protein
MEHPQALSVAKISGPVHRFARNRLCALIRPGLAVESATLLDRMLDPAVRLGTSTPGADPSGDYAWRLFEKAESLVEGAYDVLAAKALRLAGGAESPVPPPHRNPYAWIMEQNRADIFITYCTNAALATKELPDLKIVAVPDALAVAAEYGLTAMKDARPRARRFAAFILSRTGRAILANYGFGLPPGN